MTDLLHRRRALAVLAGLSACVIAPGRALGKNGDQVQMAAAWERQGSFYIGLLSVRQGAGQALQVDAALEVPARAHGLCVLPDGALVATARRPGDWLVRWHAGQDAEPQWLWQTGERSFNGHVLASTDGQQLCTTETDTDTGASWVVVRDARTLAQRAEWTTHGIDAHELIWDPARAPRQGGSEPTLIVANGGVPTAPETGRAKRHLATMDSSLVRLDARTGQLLGQWRLPDRRLSLRHLAWSADGATLGIALQAEYDDPAVKNAAPVLALFDGLELRVAAAPAHTAPSLRGYGGSVAATPAGWAVSCPRAHGIATFSPQGQWQGLVPLQEVCALAVHGAALWAGGRAASLQDAMAPHRMAHPHGRQLDGARLDNHWVAIQNPKF